MTTLQAVREALERSSVLFVYGDDGEDTIELEDERGIFYIKLCDPAGTPGADGQEASS